MIKALGVLVLVMSLMVKGPMIGLAGEPNNGWLEKEPNMVEKAIWRFITQGTKETVQEEINNPENKERMQGIVQKLIIPLCLVGIGYLSSIVFGVMRMREYGRLVKASSWLAAILTAFSCMVLVLLFPSPALAAPVKLTDLIGDTFGPGRPGAVVVNLIAIGMVDWLGEQILTTIKRANIAAMVRAATQLVGVLLLAALGWQVFMLLAKWANIGV